MRVNVRNRLRVQRTLQMQIVSRTRDFDPNEFDQCVVFGYQH